MGLTLATGSRADLTQAVKLEGAITLDGKLDEPAWQKAEPSADFRWLSFQDKPQAPAKANFRLLADERALYFGIYCAEPRMDRLADQPLPRNGAVWERDCVEIFLDPTGQGFQFYHFAVSAGNTQYTGAYSEGGNIRLPYDPIWESAVCKGKDFWSAEVRIPLGALYHTPSRAFAGAWRVNVARERKPADELSSWAPLVRGFHEPGKYNPVENLPSKNPRYDLTLLGLKAHIVGAQDDRYTGSLEIQTSASPEAAGEYRAAVYSEDHRPLADQRVTVAQGDGRLTLSNLTFPKPEKGRMGKQPLQVVLRSADQELIAGAWYPVVIEYSPLTIEIRRPFYATCIFPGQDVRAIEGTIRANLPVDTLRNPSVRISLQGPGADGKPLSRKLQQGAADFRIEAGKLQVGEFPLKCELLSAEKPIAEKTVIIRKLAKPAGSCVYIDENLNLVVNGTPTFVRSWMSNERYMVSRELLKKPHPDSPFVNLWHGDAATVLPNGQYLCPQAEILDPSEAASRVKMDVEPSPKVIDGMKRLIAECKDQPELRFYYLCDEPECRMVSPIYLKHQYDLIKALDPYHPVVIVSRAPEDYTRCADILSPHPYINPGVDARGRRTLRSGAMTMIRRQIQTVLAAGQGRVVPWLTPQAFTYAIIDPEADYPSFAEFRCMIYSAVANGCRGFYTYIYFDHFNSIDLRLGCNFIYETLASLEPFLLSPGPPAPVQVRAPENGVDVWVKKVDGQVLLIAANVLDQEVDASISSAALRGIAELQGYREKTTAKVTDGACSLHFAPYQVHLLTSPRLGGNLKPVEELQAEIAAAKAALKKPGNILYGRGREIQWDASDNYPILGGSFPILTLTDGICDAFGWQDVYHKAPARVEMAFPNFVPKFKSAKIYSSTVKDLEFWIWKAGKWLKAGEVKGNQDPVINLTFPEPITTVKIKLLMPKIHPDTKAELYEIELYE